LVVGRLEFTRDPQVGDQQVEGLRAFLGIGNA